MEIAFVLKKQMKVYDKNKREINLVEKDYVDSKVVYKIVNKSLDDVWVNYEEFKDCKCFILFFKDNGNHATTLIMDSRLSNFQMINTNSYTISVTYVPNVGLQPNIGSGTTTMIITSILFIY